LHGPELAAVREFRSELTRLYGPRLREIVLYGSWARGEATEDSDIDLAVVLAGRVRPGREIDHMADAATNAGLKHNVLLSIYPVSQHKYRLHRGPLLSNLRREGIPL
jgi:predicted nucleotidyltransferase